MKILVVEDSNLMRKAIAKVVTSIGFQPVEASNGVEALEQLKENKAEIGLVIMDWNMPVMDGYEALVQIRSDEEFDEVPVLMATSEGINDDILKATKAGADGYMVKPFKMSELALKINEMVDTKHE